MTRREVTVASPIGARTQLTPAADQLLQDLEARVYLGRPCWLMGGPGIRRRVLVVPVDYSRHPERLRGVSDGTVAQLERFGLVELSGIYAPAPLYGYREDGDPLTGRTIALTALGRQRLTPRTRELEAEAIRAAALTETKETDRG